MNFRDLGILDDEFQVKINKLSIMEENMAINYHCGVCKVRAYAEKKPDSLIALIWRLHTMCCPQWKAYRRGLVDRLKWATQDILIGGPINY